MLIYLLVYVFYLYQSILMDLSSQYLSMLSNQNLYSYPLSSILAKYFLNSYQIVDKIRNYQHMVRKRTHYSRHL
jgi:hypothetical protein